MCDPLQKLTKIAVIDHVHSQYWIYTYKEVPLITEFCVLSKYLKNFTVSMPILKVGPDIDIAS
jgi:hypothetical protein